MVKGSLFLVLTILLVGCSSSSSEPDIASTQPSETPSTVSEEASEPAAVVAQSDDSPSTPLDETEPAATETATEDSSQTDSEDVSSSVEPSRPYSDEPPPTPDGRVDTSVYITRMNMSDTSIEMKWSNHDNAVEYQLHRLPTTTDQRPDPEAMTAENMIYVASDAGTFLDEDVESGVRYWYGLRALDADGVAVAHGWHPVAAVTDTEPPSLVGSLSAVVTNGEVLVSWTQPDENYELHGYRVLRGLNGGELEGVVTTWNVDQTSFIDDEPPSSGTATYAVVAFDFHWNESAPAEIVVDLS